MSLLAIELTTDKAAHPNLPMVGEATIPADRIVPEAVPAITAGQLQHKAVQKKTVCIPHSYSTFLVYVPFMLLSK